MMYSDESVLSPMSSFI